MLLADRFEKYIWQIRVLEKVNLICFLLKKQIKFAVSKESLSLYTNSLPKWTSIVSFLG